MSFQSNSAVLNTISQTLLTGPAGNSTIVHGLVFGNTSMTATATVTLTAVLSGITSVIGVFVVAPATLFTWTKAVNLNPGDSLSALATVNSIISATCSAYIQNSGTVALGLTGRGVWLSTVTYNINDVVSYQNAAYVCLTASNLNVTPSTATNWMLLPTSALLSIGVARGLIGATINAGNQTGAFAIDETVVVTRDTAQTITGKKTLNSAILTLNSGLNGFSSGGGADYQFPLLPMDNNGYQISDTVLTCTAVQIISNKIYYGIVANGYTYLGVTYPGAIINGGATFNGTILFNNGATISGDLTLNCSYRENFYDNPTAATSFTLTIGATVNTAATAQRIRLSGASNAVNLPTPIGNAGRSLMLMCVMQVANAVIIWGNARWAAVPTPGAVAGGTDMYVFFCDGIIWYGSQAEHGY